MREIESKTVTMAGNQMLPAATGVVFLHIFHTEAHQTIQRQPQRHTLQTGFPERNTSVSIQSSLRAMGPFRMSC